MVEISIKPKEFYPENLKVEIVERKGLGHPDTICDLFIEKVSKNLAKYYFENFGTLYHFNIDKGVLVGGQADPKFGGGYVIEPIYIYVVGRATCEIGENKVPIGSIIINTAKDFFKENFRFLKYPEHIVIDYKIKKGSSDLTGLFESGKYKVPLANDTSFGSSFYPLTKLEKCVYSIEKHLNSNEIKEKYKFIGEDVKVMGVRVENKALITVACAFVDKFVYSGEDYIEKKEKVKEEVSKIVAKEMPDIECEIKINTADIPEKNIYYITVTGTSSEMGDDGQVGRGNRANGLITPMRPMSLEAVCGKNMFNHVGKIYNILSKEVSKKIYEEVGLENQIYIVSRIGVEINKPKIFLVEFFGEVNNRDIELTKKICNEFMSESYLENLMKRLIYEDIEVV